MIRALTLQLGDFSPRNYLSRILDGTLDKFPKNHNVDYRGPLLIIAAGRKHPHRNRAVALVDLIDIDPPTVEDKLELHLPYDSKMLIWKITNLKVLYLPMEIGFKRMNLRPIALNTNQLLWK